MIVAFPVRRMFALLIAIATTTGFVFAAPGLDKGFGKLGIVTTNILGSDHASSVATASGKRIIVAGTTFSTVSDLDYALTAYRITDGKLDTFGIGGKVVTAFSNNRDIVEAMVIQPDGKIVAVGSTQTSPVTRAFSAARFSSNGNLDSTFGTGGKVIVPVSLTLGGASAVTLQADGKILLAGYSDVTINGDFATARLTTGGVLDTSYGTTGVVTTKVGNTSDAARAIIVQPDKKILVAGTSGDSLASTFAYSVVRYLQNGKLDTTFGNEGKVICPFGDKATQLRSIILQSTGRIVIGGLGKFSVQARTFTMFGFKPSGHIDTSFGSQGVVNTPILTPSTPSLPMVVRPDDKIIAAGFSAPVFTGFGIAGYSKNGALLGTYGTNVPIAQYGDTARGITLQTDGRILVVGSVNFGNPGTGDDFALARYVVNW